MKKALALFAVILILVFLTGCIREDEKRIHLISREEGSGTRAAFTEILKIKEAGHDSTSAEAEVTSSTYVVITTVAGDKNAIGYVSAGVLASSQAKGVKAVSIDGVYPDAGNVKAGHYALTRDFFIADCGNPDACTRDFVKYIAGCQGADIIESEGYVAGIERSHEYIKSVNLEGTITVAGSTSVAPLMESLSENYKKIQPGVTVDIQQTGSGAGIISLTEGACQLATSSRVLTSQEKAAGVREQIIARDGIAVIVNDENPIENLTSEQVKEIFTGERKYWT